ncbi:SCO family protein [Sinimarinibacterium sp. NLF-5-8]|uniref:SCO family protein n=1 Tax=Sinimarinibacterium sp. NLF-5-8 TaxID=2698684 RepID=UPI00137BC50D|nr:SCO family protein [Sinimarinibacterium sp. NLF-5-8]QHS11214.1 SCO family protein [Sinimarinibacterium sp. NLF-5-8]
MSTAATDTEAAARAAASVWRTTLATLLVIIGGSAALWLSTDGLQAFTLESARRFDALHDPQPLPARVLQWADHPPQTLQQRHAPLLLVDFIYTRCTTYCSAMGAVYAQLQRALAEEIAHGQIELLSISFDPADTLQDLSDYRARFSRNPQGWGVGKPMHANELAPWLRAFGVVVIADGRGEFVHNAAIHFVDAQRRLIAIEDFDNIAAVIDRARQIITAPAARVP